MLGAAAVARAARAWPRSYSLAARARVERRYDTRFLSLARTQPSQFFFRRIGDFVLSSPHSFCHPRIPSTLFWRRSLKNLTVSLHQFRISRKISHDSFRAEMLLVFVEIT